MSTCAHTGVLSIAISRWRSVDQINAGGRYIERTGVHRCSNLPNGSIRLVHIGVNPLSIDTGRHTHILHGIMAHTRIAYNIIARTTTATTTTCHRCHLIDRQTRNHSSLRVCPWWRSMGRYLSTVNSFFFFFSFNNQGRLSVLCESGLRVFSRQLLLLLLLLLVPHES